MTELATCKADHFELAPDNALFDLDYTGAGTATPVTEPDSGVDMEAPTVRLPLSPFYAFGQYRRRVRERFDRFQQKVHDDFATELAALDAYLDSLGILTPAPVPQKRWRWHR